MYVKCFGMNRLDSGCPVQLSAEGKVVNRVAIWPQFAHTQYCCDYLYSPHWFPDDIMTCNFHKQSPWEEACCSFESHDFRSLPHPGYIVLFSLLCHRTLPCTHSPTDGNFLEIKIPFLAQVQSFSLFFFFLSPQSFWHRNGQFMIAKQRVSTLVHTFTLGNFLKQDEKCFTPRVWCDTGMDVTLFKPRQVRCEISLD